ncbi:EboA domain-containing protein [Zhihengliuella flava]|uniref:Sugar phosphate isomerase/epimerase n=1 Tax=Zhihengliuella flava TaxID=1285193 RepID=A0A931GFE8_9MICC|nr:EboA domain-containing protein [Zhihengliuella flava]MBG6084587.1 sugar phosphate isomerase/epimerase [Zhihengliuella flava]
MTTSSPLPFALGYGTNGLTDHPLPVALELMAEQGYDAVALTLGHPHLDPLAPDALTQIAQLRSHLQGHGMRVVIETGTRFLLDPRRKHAPALVDPEAVPRLDFLRRAVDVSAALDAECVSFFSGVLPPEATPETGWERLTARVRELLEYAEAQGVKLSIEPEPGMLVETVADALDLHRALGAPSALGVTVDIGHCVVVEPEGVRGALLQAGDLLTNVQLDDMPPHTHEHLPFGDGAVDLVEALSTLAELDYRGVAAVELPRHSHDGPGLVQRSMAALREAWAQAQAQRRQADWVQESTTAVLADPSRLPVVFAMAGRHVGRAPVNPAADPTGIVWGTAADVARGQLIAQLAGPGTEAALPAPALAEAVADLYRRGDSAERRGVLRGLGAMAREAAVLNDAVVRVGLEATADALRTNETSLVAAAVGPFAAAHLDQHAWRHAVLKLVFMGVSLDAVTDLEHRRDPELARMAADFAAERRAASRPVPADLALLTLESSHTSHI